VAIIAAGRIVAEGPPDELGGRNGEASQISFRLPGGVGAAELPDSISRGARIDAGAVSLHTDDPVPALRDLTAWATDRDVGLPGLEVRRPSLEDVYLQLIARAQHEPDGGDGPG
jgi:ABC-2 type transport system ATP-binding protein